MEQNIERAYDILVQENAYSSKATSTRKDEWKQTTALTSIFPTSEY